MSLKFRLLAENEVSDIDEIEDYGTGDVTSPKDVFDNKTHVPFYDQLFTNPERMKKEHNLVGEIVLMSPREYFNECANKIFNVNVNKLIDGRRASKQVINKIHDIIFKRHRRVFLPYINYAEKQQEGLHRMLVVGDELGWDEKFPVLVINWADEDRAKHDADKKVKEEFERKISQALSKALNYKYNNFDEFKQEMIDWQLYKELQYMDGYPFDIDIYIDGDDAVIDIQDIIKYKFNPAAIQYKSNDEDLDNDEIDDAFIDDIDFNI